MSDSEETPSQKQARLRRERRQARIQTGGSARLQAITQLSGRQHAANAEAVTPPRTTSPLSQPVPTPSSQQNADDPEITDISEHHYAPRTTPRPPISSANSMSGRASPMLGSGPQSQAAEDPMMHILQQMMGAQTGNSNAQLPPGLAEMFGGGSGGPGAPGQPQGQDQLGSQSSSAYMWRIVHAILSFALALYVVMTSPFTGSKASRIASAYSETGESFGTRLFYLFATAEVVLQSSRYFIERGQLPQSGLMGTLTQILPEPYAGYVRVAGRYSVIYTTVVADAMVVVFVLGVMAWWHGAVEI